MKANNFTVGDYVYNDLGQIFRIAQVTDACYGISSDIMLEDGEEYSEVNPIPLEKNILLKNGFLPADDKRSFVLADDYYDVVIYEITESIWSVSYSNLECSSFDARVCVCHVHELQHMLRFWGIEKELEL